MIFLPYNESTMSTLPLCLRVFLAMVKHHDWQLGTKRGYFSLQLSGISPSQGEVMAATQVGLPSGGGNWSNGYWGALLVACSSQLAQPNTIMNHTPRVATSHRELGPSSSTINQKTALQTCQQANLMDTFSQLRFLCLRTCLSLCGVDKH